MEKTENHPENLKQKKPQKSLFFLFITITAFCINISFTIIFILRIKNLSLVEKYGFLTTFILIPGILSLILAFKENVESYNIIFLIFFFLFMILEILFDFILKINFRDNWLLLVLYLILYYIMNYGLVVMPWKYKKSIGICLLTLFIIQIAVNIISH